MVCEITAGLLEEVKVDTCIGLLIKIKDEENGFQKAVESSSAEEKVEVRIKINNVSKDFTFEEFKKRLNF